MGARSSSEKKKSVFDFSDEDCSVEKSSKEKVEEPVCINSDEDQDYGTNLRSTVSCLALANGTGREHRAENCFGGSDIEPFVVLPKHVVYNGTCFCKTELTFSRASIRLYGTTIDVNIKNVTFQWEITDLVHIESKWSEQFKTANVCFYLKSGGTKLDGIAETTGVSKLKFTVSDPHWPHLQEAIKSLHITYTEKWDVPFCMDESLDDGMHPKKTSHSASVKMRGNAVHFSLDKSFEGLLYPEGDPDSVFITIRDFQLLQPETFINDTIVDFYVKYLKNKVRSEDKHRFHFFNCFFFRKLADLGKDQSRSCEGKEAFQRVRKWTRNIDIFKKDFIFIPVNFSLHWSLIVVCHPGDAITFRDKEVMSFKLPCILHMDSIRGYHRGLSNLIQSYLCEEWTARSTDQAEVASSNLLNFQFLSLELPQQQNSYDCGLFMLHYMELFVEQAPLNFKPFCASHPSTFLSEDWFPPEEASCKRAKIRELIYEIAENNSKNVSGSACNNKCSSEIVSAEDVEGTGIELPQACKEKEMCGKNYTSYCANVDIHVTPLAAKPIRSLPYSGVSRLVLEENPEPGDKKEYPIEGNDQPFLQLVSGLQLRCAMLPIQAGDETLEQKPVQASGKQLSLLPESSVEKIRPTNAHFLPEVVMDSEESDDGDRTPAKPTAEFPVSSKVRHCKNYAGKELVELGSPEKHAGSFLCFSASPDDDELKDCVVEDSQEETEDGMVCAKSPCLRKIIVSPNCTLESSVASAKVEAGHWPPVLNVEEVQVLKKRKLRTRAGNGRRVSRSLSEDLQEIVLCE